MTKKLICEKCCVEFDMNPKEHIDSVHNRLCLNCLNEWFKFFDQQFIFSEHDSFQSQRLWNQWLSETQVPLDKMC